MIKYAKFKLNLKYLRLLLLSPFLHGTPIHVWQNTSVPRNTIWETLI